LYKGWSMEIDVDPTVGPDKRDIGASIYKSRGLLLYIDYWVFYYEIIITLSANITKTSTGRLTSFASCYHDEPSS